MLQTNINKKDIPDVKPLEYKIPNDNPKLNDLHQIMIQVLESYTGTQKPCDEDSTTYIGKCYRMFLKMDNRQPKDH